MCKSQPKTQCSACGQIFPSLSCGDSPEFDAHDCPATPAPLKGESWEDFKLRADKVKAEYLASQLEQERERMVKKLVDQILAADGCKDFSEVSEVDWDALSETAEEIFTLDIEIQENQ